jgi:hypothetical protein
MPPPERKSMKSILPSPGSLATGVGALPHTDPGEACDQVLAIYPHLPYIPTLPNRGLLETIVFNDSSRLPGRVIEEGRLRVDRSARDIAAEMEQVYLDFMEQNTAPYAITPEYASCFAEMAGRDFSASLFLKCQVTGPVTLGMQVVDDHRRPIYYDDQFADGLSKMIALRVRWAEEEMSTFPGVKKTLVVLNEPYLASLGSSVVPIRKELVLSGWEDISGMVAGGLGIHCCSNTDWEFVMELFPSVISFDAFSGAKEFLLYLDRAISYMERGGIIAWGIIPSQPELFSAGGPEDWFLKFTAIREQVTASCSEELFFRQSVITPTCGIQSGDPAMAEQIMRASSGLSDRIQADYSAS